MRKQIFVLIIYAFCITLCACSHKEYPVQLKQDTDRIEKIQLIDETVNPADVSVITDPKAIAGIVPEIMALPCYKYWNDPSTSIGYLHIEITYSDGSVEFLGTDGLYYEPKQGALVHNAWYYLDFDAMCALFKKYTGVLPTLPRS